MQLIKNTLSLPSYNLALFIYISISIFFGYQFWNVDLLAHPKLATVYGGFSCAFIVAFIQLSSTIYEAIKLSKYEKMGIIEVRNERRDSNYYSEIIDNSVEYIYVIGVTASRFMQDFASDNTAETKNLITALARGVKVRILLPKLSHLNEKNKAKLINITIPIFEKIKSGNPNISIKYFDHIAAHSLVATDKDCVIGPVFPTVESMYTQSISLLPSSSFAAPYLKHFSSEWDEASEKP